MEVVLPSPRRYDATVQVPRSRARRGGLRLALTGAVAFAASLVAGAMWMTEPSTGRLVEPHARIAMHIAPKTLEANEPAAITRLVAMERRRTARHR